MSVYKYLEAFAKLEKRLSEGHEGSAATRGQPTIHEVRNKLDKFIKVLGPREIQVCVFTCVVYTTCAPYDNCVEISCKTQNNSRFLS